MAHTRNAITINAAYDKVFDLSNDIDRWKEFFKEYTASEVVSKEGNKIVFKLTHENGTSWKSYRLLFKEQKFTYAERMDPLFPFQYMKIIWVYRSINEKTTEMVWIQEFTMDAKAKYTDEQVEKMMNEHSQENLKRFKEIIENSPV